MGRRNRCGVEMRCGRGQEAGRPASWIAGASAGWSRQCTVGPCPGEEEEAGERRGGQGRWMDVGAVCQ